MAEREMTSAREMVQIRRNEHLDRAYELLEEASEEMRQASVLLDQAGTHMDTKAKFMRRWDDVLDAFLALGQFKRNGR